MRLYLDACCLNRPFDDQSQARVRMETEAVEIVLALCKAGRFVWASSEVIEDELLAGRDVARRESVMKIASGADHSIRLSDEAVDLALAMENHGISGMDALHVAVALEGKCDIFLTVDDRLISKLRRIRPGIGIKIANPLSWIAEGMKK